MDRGGRGGGGRGGGEQLNTCLIAEEIQCNSI